MPRSPAEPVREALIVCRDDLVASLRSFTGLAAVLLYLGMNLLAALPYLTLSRMIKEEIAGSPVGTQAAAAAAAASQAVWLPLFEKLTGDAGAARSMLDVPLQAVWLFMSAALFAPLVCVIVGHDQIADDLRTGHIRYLSVRCRRGALLVGRLLSRTLLMAGVVALVGAGVYALMATRGDGLPPGAWRHFARYTALLVAMVPCWVALSGLASTLVRSPAAALMLGLLLLFALTLFDFSATLGWLSPSHYKGLMYAPATWASGVGAYLGFAAAFGALAWLRLRTRDL